MWNADRRARRVKRRERIKNDRKAKFEQLDNDEQQRIIAKLTEREEKRY